MEIKEIKLNIPIPEGKEFDKYILDGDVIRIQYKDKWTPKDGDFIYVKSKFSESILIYKDLGNNKINFYAYLRLTAPEILSFDGWQCSISEILEYRPATKDEKDKLLNGMHALYEDWDPVKKEIVEYHWAPEIGDTYWTPDLDYIGTFYPISNVYKDPRGYSFRIKKGWMFKDGESCRNFCDKLNAAIINIKP